jgi:chromosomal replication initiator protein
MKAMSQQQDKGQARILEEQWSRVSTKLRAEQGEDMFRSWFEPLRLAGLEEGVLRLSAPLRFMRDWVQSHFADRLLELWQQENDNVERLELILGGGGLAAETAPAIHTAHAADGVKNAPSSVAALRPNGSAPSSNRDTTRSAIGARLNPRFTFESFIVGKSNEMAYAAARRVSESQAITYNPLFLYGPVGVGKTHLMHAIAWEIQRRSGRKVIYLSAETFMYRFVEALRFKDTMAFKQQFRSVDVLMVDDVQFISGKDSTQEEFFHTFNALVDDHRQVVITADRSPSSLDGIEERIRSRLGCGLVVDIFPTDYELRLGILQVRTEQLIGERPSLRVALEALEFLAERVSQSVRVLEGALNRVVNFAEHSGRTVDVAMVQEVLSELLRDSERMLSVDDVQQKVASFYNLRLTDLVSARRTREVVRPRQVAMYLAKQLTLRSLPQIGRKFGKRDHTTVIHAVRKIEELRRSDPQLDQEIETIKRLLEG